MLGHSVAFLTQLVWSATFVSTKILLDRMGPLEILFARFAIGFAVLAVLSPHILRAKAPRDELLFVAAAATGTVAYFLLENTALMYTTASNVAVIGAAAPFMVTAFTMIADRTRGPGPVYYVGFAVAVAGVATVSFAGREVGVDPLGDALAVCAIAVWALYSVILTRIQRRGYGTLEVTKRTFAWGLAMMLLPLVLFSGPSADWSCLAEPEVLGNLLFLGVLASAACFATWSWSLERIGPVACSAYIYMVPVLTTVIAAVVLSERISPTGLAGIAITVLGLALSQKGVRRRSLRRHPGERLGRLLDPVVGGHPQPFPGFLGVPFRAGAVQVAEPDGAHGRGHALEGRLEEPFEALLRVLLEEEVPQALHGERVPRLGALPVPFRRLRRVRPGAGAELVADPGVEHGVDAPSARGGAVHPEGFGLVLRDAEAVLVEVRERGPGLLLPLVRGQGEVPGGHGVVLRDGDPVHVRQAGVELGVRDAVLRRPYRELGGPLVVDAVVLVLHVQADHERHGVGAPELHRVLQQAVAADLVHLRVPAEDEGHGQGVHPVRIVPRGQRLDLLYRQLRLSVSPVEQEPALLHGRPSRVP